MPYKIRTESKELKMLRSLDTRMDLPNTVRQYYLNVKNGYEGEIKFDSLIEGAGLNQKFLVLNDLLLEINNSKFQIDAAFITSESIIICEIKYYKGDYYYKDGNFYLCSSKKPITNPLHQLNRAKTLLHQFLQKYGYNFLVEGHLIFNNPEFFLFQAPQNEPIIFPAHLDRFIHCLGSKPSNLNGKHQKLAELLVLKHITESPFRNLPSFTYEQFRKGQTCVNCLSFNLTIKAGGTKLVCQGCGNIEKVEDAIVRCVKELKLLFPEMKITTNLVSDWCGAVVCRRTIIRILYKCQRYDVHFCSF